MKSFKENCNDIRNSKNLELYKLNKKHHVEIFDQWFSYSKKIQNISYQQISIVLL